MKKHSTRGLKTKFERALKPLKKSHGVFAKGAIVTTGENDWHLELINQAKASKCEVYVYFSDYEMKWFEKTGVLSIGYGHVRDDGFQDRLKLYKALKEAVLPALEEGGFEVEYFDEDLDVKIDVKLK